MKLAPNDPNNNNNNNKMKHSAKDKIAEALEKAYTA